MALIHGLSGVGLTRWWIDSRLGLIFPRPVDGFNPLRRRKEHSIRFAWTRQKNGWLFGTVRSWIKSLPAR